MDIASKSSRRRKPSLIKHLMEKLKATLLPLRKVRSGQFVAIATDGEEHQKFAICLHFLKDPEFLNLLKQAEEEFGFSNRDALVIPCRPEELERILRGKKAVQGC